MTRADDKGVLAGYAETYAQAIDTGNTALAVATRNLVRMEWGNAASVQIITDESERRAIARGNQQLQGGAR